MLDLIKIMMMDDILSSLVGGNIYPVETTYTGDCIIYNFHTTQQDKITKRSRLQITIVAATMAKTLEIEERVKHLILTLADEPLIGNILQVELNGGGTLFDTGREMHHRICYFEVLERGTI